jgi:hypothetical protein
MLAGFYSQEDSWYSFLLEAESIPRTIVRLEILGKLKKKKTMTSSGFERTTFSFIWFVRLLARRSLLAYCVSLG